MIAVDQLTFAYPQSEFRLAIPRMRVEAGGKLAAVESVSESDLALAIPLYVRFEARGAPIVGTRVDYFDFRGFRIDQGRNLVQLGECVLGAGAADRPGRRCAAHGPAPGCCGAL